MNTKIIILLTILLSTKCLNRMLTNTKTDEETPGKIKCNLDLLRSYIFLNNNVENERHSMAISDKQNSLCTEMPTTCCLDDEFDQIFELVQENVLKVKNLGMMQGQILEYISEMNDEEFNLIFENINLELVQIWFNVENFKENLTDIRKNPKKYNDYVLNGIRFLLKNGSSIACGMCASKNHTFLKLNFNNDLDDQSNSIVMSNQECLRIHNDQNIHELKKFFDSIITMHQLVYLLQFNYKIDLDINTFFIQDKKEKNFEIGTGNCNDEVYFENNINFCMNKCELFGTLNHFIFSNSSNVFALNFVIIDDFLKTKKIWNVMDNLNNPVKEPKNNEVKIETDENKDLDKKNTIDIVLKYIDEEYNKYAKMGEVKQYIEPLKDAKIDLLSLKKQSSSEGGWENFKYGAYLYICLLYTSPSPRDGLLSRMPSSA